MMKSWRIVRKVGVIAAIVGVLSMVPTAGALSIGQYRPGQINPRGNFDLPISGGDNRSGRTTCRGEQATNIVQTDETWSGTDRREVVVVVGNGAVVFANGGDDLVCVHGSTRLSPEGFAGSEVFAGNGNNTVITYGGNNSITAEAGDDLIYLNGHDESATTQDGNDHIWALGASSLTAYGGSGNDLIIGSQSDDFIIAGYGDDVVLGNGGDDEIMGLYGSNKLYGGPGQDTIDGGADFDYCQDFDQNTVFTHCEVVSQPPNPPFPESG